ncbi:MAG: phosphoribosyl-AMP cyclohydrolase [Elusimicrobiota bacterium]|jgi:phosphoribosyl-AMP cyclohydrolase|nr:phosphoribosyl-AMP cyclohydrolase [Elusimicrobiota bacterium]
MNEQNFLEFVKNIKFGNDGLIVVITQDFKTNEVLMLAYMNKEALKKTIETKIATYWSRSRQKFWVKGETSGNIQHVKEIFIDCDGDAILLKVLQMADGGKSDFGAACHTGFRSCFYRKLEAEKLIKIGKPIFNPDKIYRKN